MATGTIARGASRARKEIPVRKIGNEDLRIALRQGLDDFLDLRGFHNAEKNFCCRNNHVCAVRVELPYFHPVFY